MSISFTIPGKPFAKERHRVGVVGGHARAFTAPKTRSFEQKVAEIAVPMFAVPIQGAVRLRIVATFEIPKSWSKKRRAEMLGAYHTHRPDADNLAKSILDGLNRVAFADDAQVADQRCVKRWGQYAETYVEVAPLSLDGGA